MESRSVQSKSIGKSISGQSDDQNCQAKRVGGDKAREEDAKLLSSALSKQTAAVEKQPTELQFSGSEVSSLYSQAFGQLAGQTPAPTVQAAAPQEAEPSISAGRCGELVERILASPPYPDGAAEVRIKVDKPWLPETEIRITLSPANRLEVDFQADSVEAQRFLLPNLENLRERLVEKTSGDVAVRMSQEMREGNDQGRSRNRREIIDEYDGE